MVAHGHWSGPLQQLSIFDRHITSEYVTVVIFIYNHGFYVKLKVVSTCFGEIEKDVAMTQCTVAHGDGLVMMY